MKTGLMSSAAEQVKGMAQGATETVKNTFGMPGTDEEEKTTAITPVTRSTARTD